jgi:hypothetical protein
MCTFIRMVLWCVCHRARKPVRAVTSGASIRALPGDKWRNGRKLAAMSAERSGKSYTMAWIVTVFLAVPVLYLLSVPPLWFATNPDPLDPPAFYSPYHWARDKTPLRTPILNYWNWWGGVLGHPVKGK